MGAHDYLEKPLSYDRTVKAVKDALEAKRAKVEAADAGVLEESRERIEPVMKFEPPPELPILEVTDRNQKTIRDASVIYGLGLHSGGRTGRVIQPLPPDTGIHFITLPSGVTMPAHVSSVAETDYATTLTREGESIRTVEHLLSALHACGVTNLLVKVHGEIPVLDGSALSFLERLEKVGIAEQDAPVKELVIDRRYEVGEGEKSLVIEPADVFSVSYQLRYPPPVGDQFYNFEMADCDAFRNDIAPARTRQLHPGRRGQRHQHRPPLPGRVRAPQDPRHHRRSLHARLSGAWQGHSEPHWPPRQHRDPTPDPRSRGPLERYTLERWAFGKGEKGKRGPPTRPVCCRGAIYGALRPPQSWECARAGYIPPLHISIDPPPTLLTQRRRDAEPQSFL
jgi:hypothetical protein